MEQPVDRHAAARFLAERYGPGVEAVAELGGGGFGGGGWGPGGGGGAGGGGGDWSGAFSFGWEGRDLVAGLGRQGEVSAKARRARPSPGRALPVPPVLEIGEGPDR